MLELFGEQANDYEDVLICGEYCSQQCDFIRFPEVSHEQFLNRMLARKKPMKADGKGYQDTLIWETVLAEQPSETMIQSTSSQITGLISLTQLRSRTWRLNWSK